MTELIRTWLLGVTAAAMILALAESLTPEGGVKRVCRLAGGLVLLLAAIGPILKLDEADLTRIVSKYKLSAEQYSETLEAQHDFLYESIIAQQTAAYILDKAEELEMDCSVDVTVGWKDDIPTPAAVTIRGAWTQAQRDRLSEIIASDLGVPRALQYFEEKTP